MLGGLLCPIGLQVSHPITTSRLSAVLTATNDDTDGLSKYGSYFIEGGGGRIHKRD